MRIGMGYDVHRLKRGGPLRLGGIDVESDLALEGHSDADALAHAVIDALLGAAALGDIGDHFPPSDPAYRGIDSMELLAIAAARVREAGFEIVNVDGTVVAERPKLGATKKAMAARMAEVLGLAANCVNVKATTNESMGFVGRVEGIAAMAVGLLEERRDG